MPTSKIIIIAGPTASGKSNLALTLAEQFNGIIINADSMQVYKDIPILAATPSKEDFSRAPHKLYGIYDAAIKGNMIEWLNRAKQEIDQALQNNQTPIVVGGTGMYIEALEKGASPIPETPLDIRQKVETMLQEKGLNTLYKELKKIDEQTAAKLSENDTTRIRRALEIYYHTKKTMSYWQTVPLKEIYPITDFVRIYIKPPREDLDTRARMRFDIMIKQGALDEVTALVARHLPDSLPAMRALGVQELKAFILGKCSLNEAVENAKLHTRQYAKRQSTWFNNRFTPDFCYPACFKEDKNFVDDIKKAL